MKNAGAKFVIIRAGQNSWVDSKCAVNMQGAKNAGLPRGTYWFYDSRATPQSQAALYIKTLNGDLGELPLFADFEENYGGAYRGSGNWKIFINELHRLAPNKKIGIYTAYYYFTDTCAAGDKSFFAQYPLWIANYGVSTPRIPAPWTGWKFWQYTSTGSGPTYGVGSLGIDLNQYNGTEAAFNAEYGTSITPPPPPPSTQTHPGVNLFRVRRFSTDCYIHVIDMSKMELRIKYGFLPVTGRAIADHAALGFNIGGWGSVVAGRPNEYVVIDGLVYNTVVNSMHYLNIKDTTLDFLYGRLSATAWDVIGFDRFIGRNGVYNIAIDDPNPDPRTVYGKDTKGNLVIMVCEGRTPTQKGLTFPEVWSVMREFNVTDCGNADGGYSSCAYNDKIGLVNQSYTVEYRPTVTQALFFPKTGVITMATARTLNDRVKVWSLPDLNSTFVGYFPANTTFSYSEKIGSWFKIATAEPWAGYWMNGANGKYIIDNVVTPPPVDPPPPPVTGQTYKVTLHDDVTNETYSGTLTKQ